MRYPSTFLPLFSHSVNQFVCSYLSLSHKHSGIPSALKFTCSSTSNANMLATLLASSPNPHRDEHTKKKKKLFCHDKIISEPCILHIYQHITVYYKSDDYFLFYALCGNEIILSGIKDFFQLYLILINQMISPASTQAIKGIVLQFIIINSLLL